jgi:predicted DNA-binding transcriptional regulator YafY
MARKIDDTRSYGQKLISLFARLLFSREAHSLTDLARFLGCSKQTVLRLVDDIRRSYQVEIQDSTVGNRKYFRIRKPTRISGCVSLTGRELAVLQMCQAFAEHLLGREQFEEATLAIHKTKVLLPDLTDPASDIFGAIRLGTIDYSPHQEAIHSLIEAMQANKVCKVSYQAIMGAGPKVLYIKPLKIFSHQDSIYLHARLAKTPGKPYKEPEFDPLLAVHRMKQVELTDRTFDFPDDYNFEKVFNRHFGIIKEKAFSVEAVFSGWSARYVAERIWSPDQEIEFLGEGKIKLTLTASSEAEVISWLLSYGEEAQLLKPEHLVDNITGKIKVMNQLYI